RAYWLGLPAGNNANVPGGARTFADILAAAGWHTALVSDDAQVMQLSGAPRFAEQVLVEAPPAKRAADDVDQTGLERLFAAATAWLQSPRAPFCLWIHARGMAGDWDAPLAFRNQFAEEEDPTPPDFVVPPNRRLQESFDPDELLGIAHAYAGQV